MKLFNKILTVFVSVVMIISCLPVVSVFADSAVELYDGDEHVTEKIYLTEYRSTTLTAKVAEGIEDYSVLWKSNLPLLADVDDNGKVTAYDYSKRAVIQLWIDENIASIPIIGASTAEQIWKSIDNSGIDIDDANTDTIVAIVSVVVGDSLASVLREYLDNMNVKITATVIASNGEILGSDTVEIVVEKSTIASIAPTGVHITNKKVVPTTVAVGATVQLFGACTPVRLGQGVKWSVGSGIFDTTSSQCASVSSDGLVTFKKAGTATIKINPESALYAAFSDSITFTVLDREYYPVTDFSISGSSSVAEGNTTQLTVNNVVPEGAYYGDLTWSSSDATIATVDNTGLVTGLDGGSGMNFYKDVVIIAKIGKIVKEMPMRVTRSVISSVSSVEISGSTTVGIGTSVQLSSTVSPSRLDANSGVKREWGIYDEESDTVNFATAGQVVSNDFITVSSSGVITGVTAGVTTVFVRASYGSSEVFDSVSIVSGNAITDFQISGTTSVKEGEKSQLSVTVISPSDYEQSLLDNVVWTVEDDSIATVSESGEIYGRDAGGRLATYSKTTNVTATVCGISRTVSVKVKGPGGITNQYSGAQINGDDCVVVDFPRSYSAKNYPARINSTITVWGIENDDGSAPWTANNAFMTSGKQNLKNSVASISEGGVVTGKKSGTTKIYTYLSNLASYIETSRTIDIVEVAPVSITLTPPSRKEYLEGETELDTSGMSVYLTYSRESLAPYYPDAESFTDEMLKVEVTDYTVKEMNTDLLDAEQYIIVSVVRAGETFNSAFPVTVKSKEVSSIDLTSPEKYEYIQGDTELDLTGLSVTANYLNAESEVVTDYYVDYSTFDPELYDVEQNVRVEYTHAGRSAEATFPVIVYGIPQDFADVEGFTDKWTHDDVSFTLSSTHELDGAVYYYKTADSEDWNKLDENTITLSDNISTSYYFKVKNSKSLESDEIGPYNVKIDKVVPEFTLVQSVENVTNTPYDVKIDNLTYGESGVEELTLDGVDIKGQSAFEVSENGIYTVHIKTGNGYTFEDSIEIENIDTSAPEISSVVLSQTPNDAISRFIDGQRFGKYFTGNITATVNSFDYGVAGIEKTEYRLTDEDGVAVTEWEIFEDENTELCTTEFKGFIEFRVTDKAGNVSDVFVSDGFVKDGVKPVITAIEATSGGLPYENGSWVADAVRFTPKAEAFSGIYEYYMKIDEEGEWTKFNTDYIEVTEDGSHEYFFKAISYSGLESEVYGFRVNIDRVVPLIRVDFEGTFGRWTSENVKFTLSTLNECPSGVKYYYDCGNGWTEIDGNTATITENGAAHYRFKAINGAGSESAASDSYNVMIDVVEPSAIYIQGETDKTSTPYDIAIVPVCGESGIRKVYFDGEDITETLTATVKKNGRYILTIIGENLLSSTQVITVNNFSNMPSEMFTYTFIDEKNANIISYNGKNDVVTVPYDVENHSVTVLQQGAFRENPFVQEVTIQNGFEKIGEACFVNCTNLEKITIPDTVTSIGECAFSGCPDVTIYCYKDSVAQRYAEENGIPYVLLDIKPLGRTEIDSENLMIYSDMAGSTDVSDFVSSEDCYIVGVPSQVCGTTEYFGTGSIIYFFKDGKVDRIYKFILRGDLNGDGFVDVLDATLAERASNEKIDLYDDYVLAGDYDFSGGIEQIDYQCVVNAVMR